MDIMGLIKGLDVLPSDNYTIINNIKRFLNSSNSSDPSTLVSQYLNTLAKVNNAKYSKEEYNKVRDIVDKNHGLDEVAQTSDGRLYVQNVKTKKIQAVPASMYVQNQHLFVKLTNSDILYMRAHDTTGTFNNKILSDVQNGIGWPQVQKLIKDAMISGIGSTKNSQSLPLYKELNTVYNIGLKEGLYGGGVSLYKDHLENFKEIKEYVESGGDITKIISDRLGPMQGIYNITLTTETNREQLYNLARYIYTTLPQNAKNLLLIRGEGDENKAFNIIAQVVVGAQEKSDYNLEVKYDKDPYSGYREKLLEHQWALEKDYRDKQTDLAKMLLRKVWGVDENGNPIKKGSSGDGDDEYDKLKFTPLDRFAMGAGAVGKTSTSFQLPESFLKVTATNVPVYTPKVNGRNLPGLITLDEFSQSDAASIMSDISIGGIPVEGDMEGIAIQGKLYNVQYMAEERDGAIVPYIEYTNDVKSGKYIKNVREYQRQNNIKTPLNNTQQEYVHYITFGKKNYKEMIQSFAMANAYVSEDAYKALLARVPKDQQARFKEHFIEVTGDQADRIKNSINSKYNTKAEKDLKWEGKVYKANFSGYLAEGAYSGEATAEQMEEIAKRVQLNQGNRNGASYKRLGTPQIANKNIPTAKAFNKDGKEIK